MARKVSAAQAKAELSALVAEVAFGGQHIVIERRGKPLAGTGGPFRQASTTKRSSASCWA